MKCFEKIKSLILFMALVLSWPAAVFAQFEMPEPQNAKAEYQADDTALNIKQQSYSANVKLGVMSEHQVFLRGRWGEYHSAGMGYFPKYLYDASVSLAAFSQKESIFLFAESKSDKPYHSSSETDFGINFFRNIEQWSNEQNTWMFMLNYSSRRTFWKGIPIPFLVYRYISEKWVFIAPFYGEYRFAPEWSINGTWIPLYLYNAGIKWEPSKQFKAELVNGISADQFLIADRAEEDEALYIKRYYLALSSEWKLCDRIALSGVMGYVFRSSYYHGDGVRDTNDKADTGNGIYGGAGLKVFF